MISLILMAELAAAVVPVTVAAEEELFDTKAAAAHIEKGIHHLKSKKTDAAIQEFEEAVAAAPEAEA